MTRARLKTATLASIAAMTIAPPAIASDAKRETSSLRGLAQPAEIVIDRWGVAHIYAKTERDAYFLQGYNAARDRLWQIDLWRKRGLGLLAANLGSAYVKQDRATRLFLYRGSMAAEWARYAPGSRDVYAAFAAGVNAYVDEVLAGKQPMPAEFALTGSRPDHWQADEIVRIRSNTLVANAKQEVLRARVACAAGLDADRLRARLSPDHTTTIPDGLDPCTIVPEIMDDYLLATGDVAFPSAPAAKLADAADPNAIDGSNNWVIAPSHSATGRPILANDPHRAFMVPSLRYLVHLNAPGLSLIGAGEPAVPGVSLGHNGTGAFGLTIFGTDQEDLYVYETKPGDPDSYRYRGKWEKMKLVRERVPVKGGAPVEVTLRFTRHGPVLRQDPAKGRAFALRTAWSEPGASGYAAASWLAKAKSWSDFRKAADHWGTPPLNLIWADTGGTTGWIAAGFAPIRSNWDGLLPVPGDGRYEWQGVRRPGELPQIKDPAKGWFASANEMNLPDGFRPRTPISYEWSERSRIDRISQVIGGKPGFSVLDAMALQMDTGSGLAARMIALVGSLEGGSPDARRALALIKAWDGRLAADSVAATIYETWVTQHLGPVMIARIAPAAQPALERGAPDAVLALIEANDPLLGPDPKAAAKAMLLESLEATLADLRQKLGTDIGTWQWGRLHTITLKPAVAALADEAQQRSMTIGPEPVAGSSSTPAMTAYRGTSFAAVHGPTVRMVMDVGDWDKSMFLNMPGQSGDAADPHYRDLFPAWRDGRYSPLAYSRAAVDQVAERVIALTPSK
jgi:penicillin amidase